MFPVQIRAELLVGLKANIHEDVVATSWPPKPIIRVQFLILVLVLRFLKTMTMVNRPTVVAMKAKSVYATVSWG